MCTICLQNSFKRVFIEAFGAKDRCGFAINSVCEMKVILNPVVPGWKC